MATRYQRRPEAVFPPPRSMPVGMRVPSTCGVPFGASYFKAGAAITFYPSVGEVQTCESQISIGNEAESVPFRAIVLMTRSSIPQRRVDRWPKCLTWGRYRKQVSRRDSNRKLQNHLRHFGSCSDEARSDNSSCREEATHLNLRQSC